ncbi:MAG TPA: sigma 54-interacting transcriptional regulator, partial [Polyangiaceae bacterium]|nr:sigma 54-interacting transcriptional regulator [Polyangiaceae bacterium]
MNLGAWVPGGVGRGSVQDRPSDSVLPDQLSALAIIGQELTSCSTLAEGFSRAMIVLAGQLGMRRAVLFIADAQSRTLTVEAAYEAVAEDFRPRYGQGVAGRVAEVGRPIVVPSVWREPMALSELTEPERWRDRAISLVSVPIAIRGRCAGALSVYLDAAPSAGFATCLGLLQIVSSVIAQELRSSSPAPEPRPHRPAEEPREPAVFEYANMIGTSAVMRQVYEEVGQVAGTMATALVLGESGTGKELVARAIHANSDRARQPFIKINGAAFPEGLFESELFGHERGAFTGAVTRKKGRLDLAQGGTLFLDEIGELPLSTQVKLLRVLQFREFERLGGTETLKADVRLVAATNRDVERAVAEGKFREDLYYRLNVFTITLPSLRDRRGDIPALVEYFIEKYSNEHRRKARRTSSAALDALCQHGWPGNVRELENAVERSVVACEGSVVEPRHLPKAVLGASAPAPEAPTTLSGAVEQLERRMIADALGVSMGNLARAARALGTT